jgi:SPP1 gp7 family putative phage head morphogenesis protein
MNASTTILRALLDRGDYFESLSHDELLKILPVLERAHNEVLGMIAKTGGKWTQAWREDMAGELDDIYKAACAKAYAAVKGDLQAQAAEEAAFIQDTAAAVIAGVSLTAPAPSLLKAIVNLPTSIGGSTLEQLFDALAINSREAVYDAIGQGMLAGDTVDAMTRRLRGEVVKRASWRKDEDGVRRYHPGVYQGGAIEDVSTRQAESLARTAVMHVGNQARDTFYKANEDIIKGYQYVATLDLRTCLVCGLDDSKVFGLDEPRPQLPRHIGDRCLYIPVLKSFRDIGIDADQLPPSTRASMDGQVAESETWVDRVAKMNDAQLKDALGPGRAALYKQGVKLDDMVKDGDVVPLKELAKPKSNKESAA